MTREVGIKMLCNLLKLLMTAFIMVSFVRSANFNFHGSTSKRILKSGVLRSGGVRFQRRPAPVTTTTNKQHRQSISNFNFQGEPQVTIGATKTNVDPSTITFPQEREFENLNTNSNSGYNNASQVIKSNNTVVGSSNTGIFLRPRNKVCKCNGMPGAFICIKGRGCQCKCRKFVVYEPELSRKKRSDFNFGQGTEANIQSNTCTSSGCESTLSNIMPSEGQTGSGTQNPIINTQTQNVPVYEGEIIVARDGIRYKAYLYNNHL